MIHKSLYSCMFLFFLFISCNRKDPMLSVALEKAGANRAEMEKVLDHFKDDPQKRRAAGFLIANMTDKYSMDSLSICSVQPFYDLLAAYLERNGRYADTTIYYLSDSLYKQMKDFQPARVSFRSDLSFLSADFLIEHIEKSFEIWEKNPWSQNVDFKIFCQYILPYKCDDDHWAGTYPYLREKYAWAYDSLGSESLVETGKYLDSAIKANFTQNGPFFSEHPYMQPISRYNVLHTRLGQCTQANQMVIMTLRSLGIPATMNFIPYWGNSNASHTWTEVIGDKVAKRYNNEQILYTSDRDEIVSDMFWFKYPFTTMDGIPEAVNIRSCRTVPKVYRSNFFHAPKNDPSNAGPSGTRGPLNDPAIEDITDHYLECADVTISLAKDPGKRHEAYLCCYDPDRLWWTPVARGEIRSGKARFEKMGKNIVYLPAYYGGRKLSPAGAPFLLKGDGETVSLEPDGSEIIPKMVLYSKIPYRTNILFYAYVMLGTRFKTANRSDLSDTMTIHTIDKIPYYGQQVEIHDAKPARYAIYDFGNSPYGFIAEMEFWGQDENGREVRFEGKHIGNPGIYGQTYRELCDGDRVSHFYRDQDKENYVGFDFGTPRKIDRIVYHPRSDDNGIIRGDEYELFYWKDSQWISLGRQTGGDDKKLVYSRMPANALFRLHNRSRGKENRIFVYRNGKQIFY